MEFLFVRFIQILLDSGSVISHRYSFQERSEFARDFKRLLWIRSRINSSFNLFVTFCALLEWTGIFIVEPGGTSLRFRHLHRNARWFVIRANFWFSFSNCFHSYIVSGSYRLDISCLNFWDEAGWFLSLGVSDYCLHLYYYFHNVSADMSASLPNGYWRWF